MYQFKHGLNDCFRFCLLLVLCTFLFRSACSNRSPPQGTPTIKVVCDTSLRRNPGRVIEFSGPGEEIKSIQDSRGIIRQSTGSVDSEICEKHLKSLRQRLRGAPPTFIIVTPSEDWVFYLAMNFSTPQMTIEFTDRRVVSLSGKPLQGPVVLYPGVHGFAVTNRGTRVEHSFLPLDA